MGKRKKYNFLTIMIRTIEIFCTANFKGFCFFIATNIIAGILQPLLLFLQQKIFDSIGNFSISEKLLGATFICFISYVGCYIGVRIVLHYIDGFDDLFMSYAHVDCEVAMDKK